MIPVTISEFRKNMPTILENSRRQNKPFLIGRRSKPEYIVIPTLSKEDYEMYKSANFWKELETSRKENGVAWEEAKKILGVE